MKINNSKNSSSKKTQSIKGDSNKNTKTWNISENEENQNTVIIHNSKSGMDSSILKKTVNSFSILKSHQNETNQTQEESTHSMV